MPKQTLQKIKAGYREDLQLAVRSGWEASICRWMNHVGIEWEYEPIRFQFPVTRGRRSYLPDFWLPDHDGGTWVEVKGYLRTGDRTKIRRFKKYWPDEFAKLQVIIGREDSEVHEFFKKLGVPVLAYFTLLDKEFKDVIPGWKD